MELMVVIVLIGILTALALPSMQKARVDAHAFGDAIAVAELVREARSRAMGRGAATALSISTSAADRGTFLVYEAVVAGPPMVADAFGLLMLPLNSPLSNCSGPTIWGAPGSSVWAAGVATANYIDGVNMNGQIEQVYGIAATFSDGITASVGLGLACFTPMGRMYYTSVGNAVPVFTAGSNFNGNLQIAVARPGAPTRTVVIPSSGATRIISK